MNDLSLFGIESGLHDLFDAWQNAESPEQMEQAEVAIRACAGAEVRKVDNVRRYWRACEQMAAAAKHEAQVQTERARLWEARLGRLKAIVYEVMERFGRPKLEGQTGTLYLKGNGGKQAVEITDESMVPDELCMMEGRIPFFVWTGIRHALVAASNGGSFACANALKDMEGCIALKRVPSSSLIAEALARNCPKCDATGMNLDRGDWPCDACGGSGKHGVPGARLAERGKHVECR